MNRSIPVLMLSLLAGAAAVQAEQVEPFQLLDQHGATHDLNWLSEKSAVVIMIHGNGCPIVRNAWPTYQALREAYQYRGVEFLMLNSNLQDNQATILRESEMFKMDIPILVDETQSVGESLNLVRTAEVLVLDPKSWEIVYRGAIDDRLTYEKQKPQATEHYLRDALDAKLAGEPIEVPVRDALGCLINFPNKQARL
jgi:hypothetical protein